MSDLVIAAADVRKTYSSKPPVDALACASLEVRRGERIAVVGKSGAGKSTLLNILGLLDTPSAGDVTLLGHDVRNLSARRRDRLRASSIGFIFQESHVLPHRTVAENLDIKLGILGIPRQKRADVRRRALEEVDLGQRSDSLGRLLSGGEKQRLAVARAVLGGPAILLADEPTGNLDEENANKVLELLERQAEQGVAIVVITHDPRIASWASRTVELRDGIVPWSRTVRGG